MFTNSVGDLLATATASFLLGWAFKSYGLSQIVRNIKAVKSLPSDNVKLVVVVRTDLPMTKGKLAAQCSHAALNCYKQAVVVSPGIVKKWELLNGSQKVVLKTTSEAELKNLEKKAGEIGLVTALIRDAGRTQIPAGSTTVLGIGPDSVSKIDQITSHLKLL